MTFKPVGEEPFVFQGSRQKSYIPLVLALRARHLLDEGCIGFLSSVVDATREVSLTPVETRLVYEYLDVFPKDCQGRLLKGKLSLR